ncbi:hypothetical protein BDD12DRAFT_870689 [Trichophaea hybrida]|nr:hypothetical protein BDD12DRAFT_870689 [Trichophaea hybrida]
MQIALCSSFSFVPFLSFKSLTDVCCIHLSIYIVPIPTIFHNKIHQRLFLFSEFWDEKSVNSEWRSNIRGHDMKGENNDNSNLTNFQDLVTKGLPRVTLVGRIYHAIV